MGERGNATGVESVLTWQTGYPISVDFAAGYPRSLPGVSSASARLERGEADLAVIVGDLAVDRLSSGARATLMTLPTILITQPDESAAWALNADVRLFASRPGLEEAGTVTRSDGVSLPLRSASESRLMTERGWLTAICRQLIARTDPSTAESVASS
jgi:formylmethanofuran dehydrogenase subunit B